MVKSPDAFRTISEVAEWLGIQAHVLRFWESKFTQVKPIKRAGGRRYYRPADMLLLGGIKKLLHDDGLTIKGVQKILREEGMTHVAALSAPLDDMPDTTAEAPRRAAAAAPETGVVLKFGTPAEAPGNPTPEDSGQDSRSATPDFERAAPPPAATASEPPLSAEPVEAAPEVPQPMPSEPAAPPVFSPLPPEDNHPRATPDPLAPADAARADAPRLEPETEAPQADARQSETSQSETSQSAPAARPGLPESPAKADEEPVAPSSLPGFLRRPLGAEDDSAAPAAASPEAPHASPPHPSASQSTTATPPTALEDDSPRPAVIDLPEFTPEGEFPAQPGLLSQLGKLRRLPRQVQPEVAGLLLHLADLRIQMGDATGSQSNL